MIRTYCSLLLIEYPPVNDLILIPSLLHNFLDDTVYSWPVHRGWDYHPAFSFFLVEERQRRLLRWINRNMIPTCCLKEINWVFG